MRAVAGRAAGLTGSTQFLEPKALLSPPSLLLLEREREGGDLAPISQINRINNNNQHINSLPQPTSSLYPPGGGRTTSFFLKPTYDKIIIIL